MSAVALHRAQMFSGRGQSRLLKYVVVTVVLMSSMLAPSLVAAPSAEAAGGQLVSFDQELISMVNAKRAQSGLPVVQEARGLTTLSVWWSSQLADGATGNNLEHNPNAFQQVLSYGASNRTAWGENVAKWSPSSVTSQAIFDAYWASPGHKANILGANFRFVGMGSVTGANGTSWNTMTFTDQVESGQVVQPLEMRNPTGNLESMSLQGASVLIQGWALDPDALSSPVDVHIYDYKPSGTSAFYATSAYAARTDISNAYPGAGPGHGLFVRIPISDRGVHRVCVYLINQGPGTTNPELGCRNITVGGPFGDINGLSVSGQTATITGWSVDPDQPYASTQVHIYDFGPDGTRSYATVANLSRVDVSNAYPGVGANHGYSVNFPVAVDGSHRVCAYAINTRAPQSNPQLGCWTINVYNPLIGSLDSASSSSGQISLNGWAFDPMRPTDATQIHVYVTGSRGTAGYVGFMADKSRSDVGSYYPQAGPSHGFNITVPNQGSGLNKVCAYVISARVGTTNPLLGCRDITS